LQHGATRDWLAGPELPIISSATRIKRAQDDSDSLKQSNTSVVMLASSKDPEEQAI
jgi:hypothetical protein